MAAADSRVTPRFPRSMRPIDVLCSPVDCASASSESPSTCRRNANDRATAALTCLP